MCAGSIITICCWTDIRCVEFKFESSDHTIGNDLASAKLDMTFSNADLTNVRCQTIIICPGVCAYVCVCLFTVIHNLMYVECIQEVG